MNDEENDKELENFWGLLKENQVIVPLNLKHILSTNNLVGIRVMAEINDEVIKELESSVREMGNVDIASKMSEEDKVKLFGPIYKLCPDKFKFSIGDKMVLRVIQKVSKELEASFKVVTKIKDPAPTIKGNFRHYNAYLYVMLNMLLHHYFYAYIQIVQCQPKIWHTQKGSSIHHPWQTVGLNLQMKKSEH